MDADLVSTPRAQRGEIIAEARECISRNIGRRPSPSDWEWSAAAQMRLSWAGKKLDEAESRQIEWEGDEVLSLKDAIQARAWCGTAESILMRIPPSATVADQSSARPAADKYIKSAEKLLEITGNTESGLAWHVGTAKQSYERGEYVAAAYDALYGISFSSAPSSVSDYEKVASAMNATEFKSAWGGTYYSQARYTLESGGDLTSVFQLSLYALSLENATTEIGNSLSGNPGDGAVSGRNSGNSDLILLIAAFAMAGVLISVHKLVRDGYGKPTK
ncbi:MAG: hypothetical protein NT157_04220 [Candidatus Micrarchaeota archaeon]|nr:hypothetical protein [Candidatus Micrarchaeota archaeon]